MRSCPQDPADTYDIPDPGPLWHPDLPEGPAAARLAEPAPTDGYAVVDDLDDDIAVVEVCSWPVHDRAMRLRFGEGREHRYVREELQAAVDAQRARFGQDAPNRPLRIGDAFWIRGPEVPDGKLEADREIIDITRAAREQAKIAFHGAVVRPMTEAEVEAYGMQAEEAPADRVVRKRHSPGSTANPEV